MLVYIYAADIYCEQCGEAIREEVIHEGFVPDDPDDEASYDSGEFPKGPYLPEEADCPQHCGSGPDCINAIELDNGRKVGAWLENDLTADGIAYVQDAIQRRGPVPKLWASYYAHLL